MPEHDLHNLGRFVDAQEEHYATAIREIRAGAKRSHWMWFIFPQIAGLGRSEMAQRYAIKSVDEAAGYLAHPILGARLRACVDALQGLPETTAVEIFGPVDAIKLRSSLTLFSVAGASPIFGAALRRWFGCPDPKTLALINAGTG